MAFNEDYPFEQAAYERGYDFAVSDIKRIGYNATREWGNSFDSTRDGFTLGYLTALGVYEERMRSN